MGTGKTTAAKKLGEATGRRVCELDDVIVRAEGKTIPEIFEQCGEEGFREIESRELEVALRKPEIILSCGGGTVLREKNRKLLKEKGLVVLLTAKPETVLMRVQGDENRPNLQGRMSAEGIRELMEKRRAAYEAAADTVIATDDKTIEEIAREIMQWEETLRGHQEG